MDCLSDYASHPYEHITIFVATTSNIRIAM